MSDLPGDLKYASSHEWARLNDDGTVTVGITDHAQDQLGDLVFVELPEMGQELAKGDSCAVVESVKAASDIYAPVGGEIVAVNEGLEDEPELVNDDAFDKGWLFTLKPTDAAGDLASLMDADAYAEEMNA